MYNDTSGEKKNNQLFIFEQKFDVAISKNVNFCNRNENRLYRNYRDNKKKRDKLLSGLFFG